MLLRFGDELIIRVRFHHEPTWTVDDLLHGRLFSNVFDQALGCDTIRRYGFGAFHPCG